MLGLPDGIRGCLFDLDGVITTTATVHDAAWQEMFDGYPHDRSRQTGEPIVPFDPFGCVVGADRLGQPDALRDHGADVVVAGLADLLEHP